MNPLAVSLVQVGYGDEESPAARVDRVVALVEELPETDLVVLPELWAHGGFAFDTWAERAEEVTGATVRRLADAAASRGVWLHAGSIIERAADRAPRGAQGRGLWNTSVLISPEGRVQRTYRKLHRFGFGDGEPVLIEAGEELAVTRMRTGTGSLAVGLATCYDLRFPELFRAFGDEGVELVILPAAWPLARVEHWRLLGRARAVENQTWMLQCNTAGTHSGVTMGGHSQVVAPTGEVVGELGVPEGVLRVEIDLDLVAHTRQAFPVLADRRLRPRS